MADTVFRITTPNGQSVKPSDWVRGYAPQDCRFFVNDREVTAEEFSTAFFRAATTQ